MVWTKQEARKTKSLLTGFSGRVRKDAKLEMTAVKTAISQKCSANY